MYEIILSLHTPVRLWAVAYRGVIISLTALIIQVDMNPKDTTQQQLSHDDLIVMAEAYIDLSPYKEYAHRLVTQLVLQNEAISDKYRDMLLRYLLEHHTLAEMSENALYQLKHFLEFAEHELLVEYVRLVIKLKQCKQDQS